MLWSHDMYFIRQAITADCFQINSIVFLEMSNHKCLSEIRQNEKNGVNSFNIATLILTY